MKPIARSRSSSSGGCGRFREHVRQVPAVADLQWKVLRSIFSTKWWTFQLCYGDRYGCLQVQVSDKVVSLPGIVHYRPLCRFHWCSSWRRRSSSSLSWCKGRSPWSRLSQQTTEISPLQYINEVIDALLWEDVLSQRHFRRGLRRTALLCCNFHSSHPLFHGRFGS